MYHILTAKRQRQYGAFRREYHPQRPAAADPPGLVELGIAVRTRVGGVDQHADLAAPGGSLDLLRAGYQAAGAGLEPEPVERGLAQGSLDPGAEIVRDGDRRVLERMSERPLQSALCLRRLERIATDADPGATTWRA